MSTPLDFTAVELEHDELNVFVLGPGHGEAVVIDLPGPGWLVLDGVGRKGELPVLDLLTAHLGTDVIEAVVLTHPHLDHYRGMRELIDHPQLGPRVRRVACVDALVADPSTPPKHSFAVEIHGHYSATNAAGARQELGRARALLERIQTFWSVDPRRKLALVEGPLNFGNDAIRARTLAPSRAEIDEYFRPEGRARRLRDRTNQISAVIELRFGRGRFLFTGDLSDPSWTAVVQREPLLSKHRYLKLPHHGSEHAQPLGLMRGTATNSRTWVVTPFNRGRSASRPPTQSGLRQLLDHEPEIHMTGFPVAWSRASPTPARVTLDDLESAPVCLRSGTTPPRGRMTRRRVDRDLRQRDCYWLFCFDVEGRLTRSARGEAATTLVRTHT